MYFAGSGALARAGEVCGLRPPVVASYRGSSAGAVLATLCAFRASRPCAEAFAETWGAVSARYLRPDFAALRLAALRALVGALAGSPDAIMRACPASLALLALDASSLRAVCFSAADTPEAPLALALAACTAQPVVTEPVRWRGMEVVDVEFLVPPRALERSLRPRSLLVLDVPAPRAAWPLSHPAAERLHELLAFPRRMLDRACQCQTAFLLGRWPASRAEMQLCCLLLLVCGALLPSSCRCCCSSCCRRSGGLPEDQAHVLLQESLDQPGRERGEEAGFLASPPQHFDAPHAQCGGDAGDLVAGLLQVPRGQVPVDSDDEDEVRHFARHRLDAEGRS